jgi:hypothetical protein
VKGIFFLLTGYSRFTGHLLLKIFEGELRMLELALLFVVPRLLAMSTVWSLLAVALSLLNFVVFTACGGGFRVRVSFRIIHLSTDQASDAIGSLFECKWLLALRAIYNVDHVLVPDRDQVQGKGTK